MLEAALRGRGLPEAAFDTRRDPPCAPIRVVAPDRRADRAAGRRENDGRPACARPPAPPPGAPRPPAARSTRAGWTYGVAPHGSIFVAPAAWLRASRRFPARASAWL